MPGIVVATKRCPQHGRGPVLDLVERRSAPVARRTRVRTSQSCSGPRTAMPLSPMQQGVAGSGERGDRASDLVGNLTQSEQDGQSAGRVPALIHVEERSRAGVRGLPRGAPRSLEGDLLTWSCRYDRGCPKHSVRSLTRRTARPSGVRRSVAQVNGQCHGSIGSRGSGSCIAVRSEASEPGYQPVRMARSVQTITLPSLNPPRRRAGKRFFGGQIWIPSGLVDATFVTGERHDQTRATN